MSFKNLLNLNINKDDSDINDYIWVWDYYKKRPNKITIHKSYTLDLEKSIEDYETDNTTFSEIIPSDSEDIVNDRILSHLEIDKTSIFISYVVIDRNFDSPEITSLSIYYKESEDLKIVDELIKNFEKYSIQTIEEVENNLYTTSISSSSTLITEPLSPITDLDNTDLYYSSKTFKSIKKSLKNLKKNTKGLFIFYGERGTGKTSVINYLANNLNRTVIFVPNSMIEHTINNSDFRKFLNKYHNPIVILDDCEMIFNDYFNRTNLSAYNLLQLSEGIFLDNVNATFITIFNVDDISEIDQNFIDCNNLIDIVEFEYLSSDESNELSAHLSDKTKYKNKNKLNDIIKKRKVLNNKKIGF
jgi:hypothetical protein